ncbi:MAG: hypothetical protein WBM24_19910, partial [Candidatus Sulfotelmatobacter sp.]
MANSAQCSGGQSQAPNGGQGADTSSSAVRNPTLINSGGFSTDQYTPSKPPLNPSEVWQPQGTPRPETEFEQMVA